MSNYSITCESNRDCVFSTHLESEPSSLRISLTDTGSQHVAAIAAHHLATASHTTKDGTPYGGHAFYAVRDANGDEVEDLEFHGKLPDPAFKLGDY